LLVLLVGTMTAALLLPMTAAAALLGTMTALLLPMSTATLLVTMPAATLLWGAVANVALGLRPLAATALLWSALVGSRFFRGQFHGEAFGERHFTFAALGGA
jgi:hypothetical protein